MPDLGKAYVQIVPSAKGMSGAISKELGGEAESAGTSAGNTIVSKIKGIIAAAGIGAALKSAISEGANLEQAYGGIETLFKDSSDKVKQYAAEAYKTAGVSANDYMEQVTSFSASLLQSLGGDTEAAADSANQALIDMSDNANKMGTSMESIQNAYQGFAKQNYTMLDNLKLGYGGTKTEMERLLADATKLTGVEYDISNLDDVYSAIHVIQEDLGVTGTTAEEAASTFSGSLASMKAAAQNLMGNLALGENVEESFSALITTAETFLVDNFMPMLTNVMTAIPDAIPQLIAGIRQILPQLVSAGGEMIMGIIQGIIDSFDQVVGTGSDLTSTMLEGITEGIPKVIEAGKSLVSGLVSGIKEFLPQFTAEAPQMILEFVTALLGQIPVIVECGVDLLTSLIEALPTVIENIMAALPDLVSGIIDGILSNIPLVIQAGIDLLVSLVENLPAIIQGIVEHIPELITGIIEAIVSNIPLIVEAGVQLFIALITNLPLIIIEIVKAIPEIIMGIVQGFVDAWPTIKQSGADLLTKLGEGIVNIASTVWNVVKNVGSDIINGLKSGLGNLIEVGKNWLKGLWEGISNAVSWVIDKVKGVASSIVDAAKSVFGIHSPSKVMRQIGLYTMQGWALGIEDGTGLVTDAMAAVNSNTLSAASMSATLAVDAASSGTNGTLSSISDTLNGMAGRDGTVVLKINDRVLGRALREMGVQFA